MYKNLICNAHIPKDKIRGRIVVDKSLNKMLIRRKISFIYQVHVLYNFIQTVSKLHFFPNCKGPGPIPNTLKKPWLRSIQRCKYTETKTFYHFQRHCTIICSSYHKGFPTFHNMRQIYFILITKTLFHFTVHNLHSLYFNILYFL